MREHPLELGVVPRIARQYPVPHVLPQARGHPQPAEKQAEVAKYAKKTGVTKETITADVPANTEVTVAIGGALRKTEVKYTISNRK